MNQAYAPAGITWVLAGTTRTVNADWFGRAAPNTTQQNAMKAGLRQGGAGDLNVYSVGFVFLLLPRLRETKSNGTFLLKFQFWICCWSLGICHVPLGCCKQAF
jgi:hypothetical protein